MTLYPKIAIALATTVALVSTTPSFAASPKPGAICKSLGQKKKFGDKTFSCVKKGKKFVWSVMAKTPPTIVDTPKTLFSSSLITSISQLSDLQFCKTVDLTKQGDPSNGFPRNPAFFTGPLSARLLVIPISFTDHAFKQSDYAALQTVTSEVTNFYRKTSYGKVNLNFELLDKKFWVEMSRSASSYDLIANKPQQNNMQVVVDALNLVDTSINFDLYDGVIVESGFFKSTGGGQGFPGRSFQTRNGVAKRVAFEFGMYVGKTDVLAHELGHSLFGLEDLYVFLNSNRPAVPDPNPAGSWDMMSDSTFEFLGWNKLLMGWLEDSQIRCVQSQSTTVHYLESLENSGSGPKLVVVNLEEGVSLAFEVRNQFALVKSKGLLAYKIDTRISHGDGPIVAEKKLLFPGETLQLYGWNVKVLDRDSEGVLFQLSK